MRIRGFSSVAKHLLTCAHPWVCPQNHNNTTWPHKLLNINEENYGSKIFSFLYFMLKIKLFYFPKVTQEMSNWRDYQRTQHLYQRWMQGWWHSANNAYFQKGRTWVWSPELVSKISWAWWSILVIPVLGRQRQEDSCGLLASQLSPISKFQANWETLSQKPRRITPGEWHPRLTFDSACICTSNHTDTSHPLPYTKVKEQTCSYTSTHTHTHPTEKTSLNKEIKYTWKITILILSQF